MSDRPDRVYSQQGGLTTRCQPQEGPYNCPRYLKFLDNANPNRHIMFPLIRWKLSLDIEHLHNILASDDLMGAYQICVVL